MEFVITNADRTDLPAIYLLFEEAIRFQKMNHYTGWNSYDKEFIQTDIQKRLLYKIIKGDVIICIFSICYRDGLIWQEMEKGDALYLHRIVLNQAYKGDKTFQKVLDWAIKFAGEKDLKYIRMDTWADNEKIITYYKSYGFTFIKFYTTPDTKSLPEQHRNLKVILLELAVNPVSSAKSISLKEDEEAKGNKLEKVNIPQELITIDSYWSQKIIGTANGQLIKLAKGIGEINWHKHEDQDELFILYKGHMTIQLRGKNIELFPNDMFIVPRGMEHCPKANGDTEFLIMGLNITSNTAGGRPANWPYEECRPKTVIPPKSR